MGASADVIYSQERHCLASTSAPAVAVPQSGLATVVHGIETLRLDYCNTPYKGLSLKMGPDVATSAEYLSTVLSVDIYYLQNIAAHELARDLWCDSVGLLHWVLVHFWAQLASFDV